MKNWTHHLATYLLVLQIAVNPALPAIAAEESGGPAIQNPGVLSTVANGMNMVGSFANGIGVSQQQMQQMVNQMGMLNGTMMNGQNAFSNVQMTIAQAQAEAQQCSEKAKVKLEKYKKFNIKPSALSEDGITCTSYGKVIDSASATLDRLGQGQQQMACLLTMQNKIQQAADQAKVPFESLTNAAKESWNIRKSIIDMHTKIGEKLGTDLEEYGKRLEDLNKLSLDLNIAINGRSGGDQISGLAKQIDDLKAKRIDKANNWYRDLMYQTQTCFFSDNTRPCEASGGTMSPAACIAKKLNPTARSGGAADRNARNAAALQKIFAANAGKYQSFNNDANLDIKNPATFFNFANTQFERVSESLSAGISNAEFAGSVNTTELKAFFKAKLRECYNDKVTSFSQNLKAGGSSGPAGEFAAVINEERELSADMQNLIQTSRTQMNAFKTLFTKIYSSELPQFDANCSASEDPYLQLDCVRILSTSLKAGLSGTAVSAKLSNGSTYTANEGVTTLNVQKVSLDAQGKPTLGTTQIQCRGFDDCMVFLQKQKESSDGQVSTQTADRDKFVAEHNKNIDTTLGAVATQFTSVGTMLGEAIKQLNMDFGEFGVNSPLKTTTVEGETLEADETTGLYKMPKNMKAALAGKGTYTELDTNEAFVSAYEDRVLELKKIKNKAYEMKGMCAIKSSDYKTIASKMRCDDICRQMPNVLTPLEKLLRRGVVTPKPDEKDEITRTFKDCMKDAESDYRNSTNDNRSEILDSITLDDSISDEKKAELRIINDQAKADIIEERARAKKACSDNAFISLSDDIDQRDSVKGEHESITGDIQALATSCADLGVDDSGKPTDDIIESCDALKEKIAETKAPADEGETDLGSKDSKAPATNVLRAD